MQDEAFNARLEAWKAEEQALDTGLHEQEIEEDDRRTVGRTAISAHLSYWRVHALDLSTMLASIGHLPWCSVCC